jgi:acetolactate synthase-1/2/3 large subunit
VKASDYIAGVLERRGVRHVFEMSGGMIAHLLDSLAERTRIRIVSMHHEQAAAFAADAWGRMTGIPGVAMATSGPGATNLLTGIGSCYFDSSPAVFITGQVNRHELRGDRAIRQLGFQETDIVSMARPITKAAWPVDEVEQLPRLLDAAFDLAVSGRPGPVLLDVPMDVQRAQVAADEPPADVARADASALDLEPMFADLRRARRPLILVGGGIHASGSESAARELARTLGVPAVTSLMARDVFPHGDPLYAGMIGTYGNRWANLALGACDVLLVLGSRLDIRQTGSDTAAFRGERILHHVDCEPGELNNRVTGCHAILADLRAFFAAALPMARTLGRVGSAGWVAEIDALRRRWPDTRELEVDGINPNQLMHDLSRVSGEAAAYVLDAGQNQMWGAQSLELHPGQRFITSGGMAPMGYALPAAIGTAFAAGSRPVVVIAGDGGLQCNVQELETVVRNRLPLKLVVLNNRCHGMVRQFQETYFEGRYHSTYWGYSAPDFARVAEAYGIPARTVSATSEVADAVAWLWSRPGDPALLQVMIDTFANTYPKIAFGRPITEMEPLATPMPMERT